MCLLEGVMGACMKHSHICLTQQITGLLWTIDNNSIHRDWSTGIIVYAISWRWVGIWAHKTYSEWHQKRNQKDSGLPPRPRPQLLISLLVSFIVSYQCFKAGLFNSNDMLLAKHGSWCQRFSFYYYLNILEPSGRSWLCCSTPFFKLPQLPLRDTRRETMRFQGGPNDPGRPATSWCLSWCLSGGVVGAWKRGWSNITNFFLRAPAYWSPQCLLSQRFQASKTSSERHQERNLTIPGHGGHPGTVWFLSWCLSEGGSGLLSELLSHFCAKCVL
jgi:hypothetical protein